MKAGRPRMDLATLHGYLSERLAAAKWPQCLVFMESLPKSHTNKLLRVKLGTRLRLPELSDEMNATERTFEAVCPPQGTAIDVLIQANRVALDASDIGKQLSSLLVKSSDQQVVVVPHSNRKFAFVCYLINIDRMEAIKTAIQNMARYSVPSHFVETDNVVITTNNLPPPGMADAVATILQEHNSTGSVDLIVHDIKNLFTEMLDLDHLPDSEANFFHLGGSSMLASQLASKIRKLFAVACSGSEVFQHATANEMAKLIRNRKHSNSSDRTEDTSGSEDTDDSTTRSRNVSDHGAPFPADRLVPQNSLWVAIFQLVPLFISFPIYEVSRHNFFFFLLVWSKGCISGITILPRLVLMSSICHIVWSTVTP
jgi:acyl carrier protein